MSPYGPVFLMGGMESGILLNNPRGTSVPDDQARDVMKSLSPVLPCLLLSFGSCLAETPARITLGAAHQVVFPSPEAGPAAVYIEVFVKTTNTSTEPITFWTNCGPGFFTYVRRRKDSNHWTDISPRGLCGMGASQVRLSPGESLDSKLLVATDHAGKPFRVMLPVSSPASKSHGGTKVKSNTIFLPMSDSRISHADKAKSDTTPLPLPLLPSDHTKERRGSMRKR